jgi:hypothetical protein
MDIIQRAWNRLLHVMSTSGGNAGREDVARPGQPRSIRESKHPEGHKSKSTWKSHGGFRH